jgi:hypothetical protein
MRLLPEWDFPPMGSLLEKLRSKAEFSFRKGKSATAALRWEQVRAFASAAYGPQDPRTLAALSRAGRSLIEAARTGHDETGNLPGPEDSLQAGGACARFALAGAVLKGKERRFAELTDLVSRAVEEETGGRAVSRLTEGVSPARNVPEALWPLPGRGFTVKDGPGLPGDPALPPGPGSDELRKELERELRKAAGSDKTLTLASRLGDAIAAEVFRARPPAAEGTEAGEAREAARSAGLLGEAEGLLREAVRGLETPFSTSPEAQDAAARLALFLTRDSGPLRILAREPREVPPKKAVREALELWHSILARRGGGREGKARRVDANLRVAECLSLLGDEDVALEIRSTVLMELQAKHLSKGKISARGVRALAGGAESAAAEGAFEKASEFFNTVTETQRMCRGQACRETVHSMCRLADMLDASGKKAMAATIRLQAAEALETPAHRAAGARAGGGAGAARKVPEAREETDMHVLRCLAARVFLKAGDLAEAEAVLAPALSALERLLGKGDRRAATAAKLLAKARNPSGTGKP